MRFTSIFLVLVGLSLMSGCGGSDGPETVSISGNVTLDGSPVMDGEIIFRPSGGSGRTDAAKIVNGEFEAEVVTGSKRVEIRAIREVEGAVEQTLETGEVGTEVEQYIPEKYNDKSELTADVEASGETVFDFWLVSG